ncbi:platelet glycoprotein Ib alpha chain-like [Colossoma macropomum]|uniref:platelet glycoprotein Ib alpha chain-like n=1 Tax=Colossoma macropomum TaxID=42526 RepID=UPI001864577E|nr:platelet glycoprotein Ib alpha chain-like [Colossoma macropomum]
MSICCTGVTANLCMQAHQGDRMTFAVTLTRKQPLLQESIFTKSSTPAPRHPPSLLPSVVVKSPAFFTQFSTPTTSPPAFLTPTVVVKSPATFTQSSTPATRPPPFLAPIVVVKSPATFTQSSTPATRPRPSLTPIVVVKSPATFSQSSTPMGDTFQPSPLARLGSEQLLSPSNLLQPAALADHRGEAQFISNKPVSLVVR